MNPLAISHYEIKLLESEQKYITYIIYYTNRTSRRKSARKSMKNDWSGINRSKKNDWKIPSRKN